MKVLGGVVFLVVWVTSVSEARPCPKNCQVIKNLPLPKCRKDTGTCSRGCITGYFGDKCNMRCDINCQEETCQQQDGSCACKPGYYFKNGSCDPHTGVKCKSNDHCLNNICVSASREDCLEGCNPDWSGKFCQQPCSLHCVCDVTGYCTRCTKGWYGAECGSSCSPGCMDKNCHRNGTCDNNCISGSYGDACGQKCSKHCVSGCNQMSGDCVQCEAGRYGSTCQSECSAGCSGVSNDCDRHGSCNKGCRKGFYGEKCDFFCPEECFGDLCDVHGICSACKNGFFGTSCQKHCRRCKDGVCHQPTGECSIGCQSGFYGSFCNLTCVDCKSGDCDMATGQCKYKDDQGQQWSSVQSWVVGGVAVVIVIIIAVYVSRRLKRIQGVVYDTVKWRRRLPSALQDDQPVASQGYFELEEQVTITPPRVCPSVPVRHTSYIEPRHSGTFRNLQTQPQLQAAGVSQGAAAPPSHRLLQKIQRRSDEWSERPDSYVFPHYCEVDEEGMATPPQTPQGAQASISVVKKPVFTVAADVHGTRGDIWIPPIADCFGPTETEDSSPDIQPLVENYDHLNREGIPTINGARVSSYTQDDDEVRTSVASSGHISTARPDDYIEPRHSGCIVTSPQPMLSAWVSDQQEDEPQAAVAPPSDDALIAKDLQPAQGDEASVHAANNCSLSVKADVQNDRGEINIPLIAECSGPTETEDLSPDDEN